MCLIGVFDFWMVIFIMFVKLFLLYDFEIKELFKVLVNIEIFKL